MHSKNLHMTITDGYNVYSKLQVTVTFTINNPRHKVVYMYSTGEFHESEFHTWNEYVNTYTYVHDVSTIC